MKIYKNPNREGREKIKDKIDKQTKFKCSNCGKFYNFEDRKGYYLLSNGDYGIPFFVCSKECKRQKLILLAL